MIRTKRYKLVVYHGLGLSELFDLEKDPGEFENLWDSSGHTSIRCELIQYMLDQTALITDLGTEVTQVF